MLHVPQVPIGAPMRQIMIERRWLESQGRLERKDFMLHDREHWPTINIPGNAHMQQPGMLANSMMQQQMNQQRFPQYNPYPQSTGPPAKRARHSGPNVMPGSSDGIHDTSIEDEESASLGDFFDHLTPREISMARYMQHHRWMEEVLSSPYASSQIVPPDLGLGLMGELKGLTEGILAPPSLDEIGLPSEKPNKAKEAQPFTNLKKEQIDEFNKRVEKHLEEGHAEIERMKKEHMEKLAEWKKTKTIMQAEKRLRYATWEGHENAVPTYRLDMPPATNGHAEDDAPPESIEGVVKDVESLLGVKIQGHKDAKMIEKGGLEKDEEQRSDEMVRDAPMDQDNRRLSGAQQLQPTMGSVNTGMSQQPVTEAPNTKAEALESNVPADIPQPNFQSKQQNQTRAEDTTEGEVSMPDTMQQQSLDDLSGMEMADTSMMEGMDMDVDTGDIDFVEHDELAPGEETDIPEDVPGDVPGGDIPGDALGQSKQPEAPATTEDALDATAKIDAEQEAEFVTFGDAGEQQAPAQEIQRPPTPAVTQEEAIATEPTLDTSTMPGDTGVPGIEGIDPGGIDSAGDSSMFNDDTFDDLPNMDNGAGDDGLIDFDGGMGMEDSAFDDALHGMGGEGEGEEQGES